VACDRGSEADGDVDTCAGIMLIFAGGIAYTGGLTFFAWSACGTTISSGTSSSSPAPRATSSPSSGTPRSAQSYKLYVAPKARNIIARGKREARRPW
jgi:hypothetical protein